MFVSLLLLFKKNLFQLISLFSETIQLLVRAQVMLHKNKQKKNTEPFKHFHRHKCWCIVQLSHTVYALQARVNDTTVFSYVYSMFMFTYVYSIFTSLTSFSRQLAYDMNNQPLGIIIINKFASSKATYEHFVIALILTSVIFIKSFVTNQI